MSKGNVPTISNTADRKEFHERKPVERKPEGCERVNARTNFFENVFTNPPRQTQLLPRVCLSSVSPCELLISQHSLLNTISEGLKESKDGIEQTKRQLKQWQEKINLIQQKNQLSKETPEEQLNPDKYPLPNILGLIQKVLSIDPHLTMRNRIILVYFLMKTKRKIMARKWNHEYSSVVS